MKSPGSQVAYPGIENSYYAHHSRQAPGRAAIKQVKYYQWVAFMLLFQVGLLIIMPSLSEK